MRRKNLFAICLILLAAVYAKFNLEANLKQALQLYNEKAHPQAAEQIRKKAAKAQEKSEILSYKMDLTSSQQDVLLFLEGRYRLLGLELVSERHRIEEIANGADSRKISLYEVELNMSGSAAQIVEFTKSVQLQEACIGIREMGVARAKDGSFECTMLLVLAGNSY